MPSAKHDYTVEDVVQFLKEEFERILTLYPLQREGGALGEAQAFEIWFLHQESGIEYAEAARHILDGPNDCGVDFIYIDDNNSQVVVGQAEYDRDWSRTPASQQKASETFSNFLAYLNTANMPEGLPEQARVLWRVAKQKQATGVAIRYVYVTPKHLTDSQEDKIRIRSGIPDYEFVTHEMLLERGEEFLDGQTGMCSFSVKFTNNPLQIPYDFGNVYIGNLGVKLINDVVQLHEDRRRLRALFASNVRAFLSSQKRSKEIGDSMKETLMNTPQEFLMCNNGITIQCSKVNWSDAQTAMLERASISNGCQTAMNIQSFFKEHQGTNPSAEVLLTVVELGKDASRLAGVIARSRNSQNPVDARDLMSNNFRLVCLHHRLRADRLAGGERRYYLLRKAGEKQTLLREEPEAKGKYFWIDVADLAQNIAAVIRQDPHIGQVGISNLFGKYFDTIFPDVSDPTHSSCKYAWWLVKMVYESYDLKSRWKGRADEQIYYEKDFKNPAALVVAALVARGLKEDFNFDDNFEQRFVVKAENWWYRKKSGHAEDFSDLVFDLTNNAYYLTHSICRGLVGKRLPKSGEVYTRYDDMLRGPRVYDAIVSSIRRGRSRTYNNKFKHSMKKVYEYLQNN
jgi:hypothetical protein